MKRLIILSVIWFFGVYVVKAQCNSSNPAKTLNEKAKDLLNSQSLTYPFSFAIISDAHNDDANWTNPVWDDVLADIEADSDIDFVISLGVCRT